MFEVECVKAFPCDGFEIFVRLGEEFPLPHYEARA